MIKPWKCSTCGRPCQTESGVLTHAKAKHPKKGGKAILREEYSAPESDSMADVFLDGELNRAMGIPNEDWVEDMLP